MKELDNATKIAVIEQNKLNPLKYQLWANEVDQRWAKFQGKLEQIPPLEEASKELMRQIVFLEEIIQELKPKPQLPE